MIIIIINNVNFYIMFLKCKNLFFLLYLSIYLRWDDLQMCVCVCVFFSIFYKIVLCFLSSSNIDILNNNIKVVGSIPRKQTNWNIYI